MVRIALIVTAINRFFYQTAKWVIFVIVPVMLFEVVRRYIFSSPTVWATELSTLLFGPYFLLGGPYLLHTGGHVAVDLLKSKAGPRTALAMEVVALLSALAFAVLLTVYSVPQALNSFDLRETSFSAWNPQIWPYKAMLPLASFLLTLQALAEAILLFSESGRDAKETGKTA